MSLAKNFPTFRRQYGPTKRLGIFIQWHSEISQKSWNLQAQICNFRNSVTETRLKVLQSCSLSYLFTSFRLVHPFLFCSVRLFLSSYPIWKERSMKDGGSGFCYLGTYTEQHNRKKSRQRPEFQRTRSTMLGRCYREYYICDKMKNLDTDERS